MVIRKDVFITRFAYSYNQTVNLFQSQLSEVQDPESSTPLQISLIREKDKLEAEEQEANKLLSSILSGNLNFYKISSAKLRFFLNIISSFDPGKFFFLNACYLLFKVSPF